MSEYAIDVSPLCIEYGELRLDDESTTSAPDLVAWLRERRIAAAVRPAEQGSIFFAVAHSADQAIQLVGDDGALVDGMRLTALREELENAGLGTEVSLHSGDEVDDDIGETEWELPEDFGNGTVYAMTEDGPVKVEDFEWPEEPRVTVWEFSHRGPAWAEIDVLINRHPITVEAHGAWSAFGYEEPETERTELPPSRDEYPLIALHLVGAASPEEAERLWVEVKTRAQHQFGGHFLSLEPAAITTFSGTGDERTERLLTALANDAVSPDSAANQLIADETITVDAARLHAALAPSDIDSHERLSMLLRALGVPGELVELALSGGTLRSSHVVNPRSVLSHFAAIADGGMRGVTRLNRDLNAWERLNDWFLAHPTIELAFASVKAGLGAAWLLHIRRSTGIKRTLGTAGAMMILSEAAVDAALTTRRLRRTERERP